MKKAKIDIEGTKLRQKAEELLLKRNLKKNAKPISDSEVLELVHELQVHQIELELQNKELIEATKAAQIATEKYAELYDYALFGFFTLSREGEILAVNFNGAKMLGKNRSELVNRRFSLFISGESKPIFNSFCDTIISSKAKESCEVELLNNSSSPPYLHLSGVIKENDDQLFVMALDITSRKLAEIEIIKAKEKAEENEAKFRELFSNVNDAVFMYNPDTFEILEANEATSELYGYDYDELIGMSCLKFSAELEKSKSVAKLIMTEKKVTVKLRHHKKKDGSDVFVELNNYNILINGKNTFYSVCHDITDIKKTELELIKAKEKAEESEDRYKIITENTLDIVFMLDKTGKQLFFNESVEKILGYKKEELIGKSFARFVPKSELSQYLLQLKNVFLKKEIQNFIAKIYHKNGNLVEVEINGKLVKHDGKSVAVGTIRDMSVRRKDELIIKQKNEELSKNNATKDKLFSIIAHDLRSPFNSILGFSELLSENVNEFSIEETKRYSGIINSAAQNSLILLDNLLNWAKSQTGNLGITPEKISLTKVILEVIQLNQLLAKPKNISLKYTPSDEFEVYSDVNMLRLVLRNLISNSIKFTKTGGNINISVISVQNQVEISVSDNGVGMSTETCKKLFDISTNITSPGTANEKGSGLGLVLCKEFVEKLGGKIWVESEKGVGSQFYFTIPYKTNN